MAKVRIVKRTWVDGRVCFIIQQKHFVLRWLWVDAWVNSSLGASCEDHFVSLSEAEEHLCYFDGTRTTEEVVHPEEPKCHIEALPKSLQNLIEEIEESWMLQPLNDNIETLHVDLEWHKAGDSLPIKARFHIPRNP